MAVGYNPKIVTAGLVLCLDAANIKSYPGSGTTWTDLSGNGNTGSLVSNPTYTSGVNGNFNFDGTNNYVYMTSLGFFDTNVNNFYSDVGYAYTVSVWFKFPVAPSGTRTGNQSWALFGQSGGIGGAETLSLFVGSATDSSLSPSIPYYCIVGKRGSKTVISPTSVNTNTWNNVVVTWNGTTGRAYFNGEDRGATNIGTAAVQTGYFVGVGITGISNSGGTPVPGNVPQTFEGSISNVLVYNSALSNSQVTQNFNALRGRYGV